jgi:hypothetical protein
LRATVLASLEVRLDCRALFAGEVRELLGYPRRPVRPVSVLQRALPLRPSPGPFRSGSFSRASSPLRSSFAVPPCRAFRSDASCQVSCPIRGITGGVHACGSAPSPAPFRPQVFATSRRLAPLPVLRACCIPLPRPGFPFRGFSRSAAVPTFRRAMPPCR